MKILIIEDEKLAADKLESMLLDVNPAIDILAKLGSVKDSVNWLMKNNADLIFLDIQLSDGISFSIFDQVAISTPVIFTTAYDQYAIKAFEINSISYLLKPVRKTDLALSLKKYSKLKTVFNIDFNEILAQLQGEKPGYKKRFLVQTGQKIRKVETSEAAYFYISNRACYLKSFSGSNYLLDTSLDQLQLQLDPEFFFRINRKFIVNINSITNMVAYSRGRIKLELKPSPESDLETIVSIERSHDFKKWLNE